MNDCTAIVLAAGLSRRMGPINKLLIPMNGQTMIRRSVEAYQSVCDTPLTVVTGYQPTEIETALRDLDIRFIFNPDFRAGQNTSVAAGLAAADAAANTLIGLGDQPFLTPDDLLWLLNQHGKTRTPKITVPVLDGARGNPLIIPLALRANLLADRQNPGCHKFTRDNPDLLHLVPTSNTAFFHDIDTPEDMAGQKSRPTRFSSHP